jgi:hypothetical protein
MKAKKPVKRKMGRPSKRTPAITAKIAKAISFGLTDQEAADIAGIDDLTLTRWKKLPDFCRAVKRAVSARKLIRLQRIDSGTQGWQGSAWALERQDPERFARPGILLNQNLVVQTQAPFPLVRVLSINDCEFDQAAGRPDYQRLDDNRLERIEGSLKVVLVRQSSAELENT